HGKWAATAQLQPVLLYSRDGTGNPRPEQPLPVEFHAATVPGAAHDLPSSLDQLPAASASVAGQGARTGPAGIGAGARAPSADRRQSGVPGAPNGVPGDRNSGHRPHGGARAAAARDGPVPGWLG